jgi:hypothetical protein
LRLFAQPLHLKLDKWPPSRWANVWYGPDHFGTERARIDAGLQKFPGRQLVIIRYLPNHYVLDEWVYNEADVDRSKVVWAREMKPSENDELMLYYHDRKVWLVEPDALPPSVTPYPMPERLPAASH